MEKKKKEEKVQEETSCECENKEPCNCDEHCECENCNCEESHCKEECKCGQAEEKAQETAEVSPQQEPAVTPPAGPEPPRQRRPSASPGCAAPRFPPG